MPESPAPEHALDQVRPPPAPWYKPTSSVASEGLRPMQWFPREKRKLDLFGIATRKEKSRFMEWFYVIVGAAFFGYAIYLTFLAG